MIFTSPIFLLFFLPFLLFCYFVVDKKFKNYILLIFSLLFYAWGEGRAINIMIIAISINYLIGIGIEKTERYVKKTMLIVGIITNLGILGYYKYFEFLLSNVNLALIKFDQPILANESILLPLGISFYTFQNISYIIDVFRGEIKAQYNWISYTLYVTFFAHLVAGPVVRYAHISAEITDRNTNLDLFFEGTKRFIVGSGKKIIIANPVGLVADSIFDTHAECGFFVYWLGILCYAIQIYFDFSGYSDMAIGIARMFGFYFHENFNMPYLATSVTDFWRRWHISLSTWFRDYVYIPLGGNKFGKLNQLRNIFIVFFLTGLWHGASWNFIIWGVIHGVFMILEKIWLLKTLEKVPVIVSRIYLLSFILLTWVLFKANNMTQAWEYLQNMFAFSSIGDLSMLSLLDLEVSISIIAGIILAFGIHIKIFEYLKEKISNQLLFIFQYAYLICLLLLCIINISIESYNPFIYYRF